MKKLFMFIVLAVMLTSCTKENDNSSKSAKIPISFKWDSNGTNANIKLHIFTALGEDFWQNYADKNFTLQMNKGDIINAEIIAQDNTKTPFSSLLVTETVLGLSSIISQNEKDTNTMYIESINIK